MITYNFKPIISHTRGGLEWAVRRCSLTTLWYNFIALTRNVAPSIREAEALSGDIQPPSRTPKWQTFYAIVDLFGGQIYILYTCITIHAECMLTLYA